MTKDAQGHVLSGATQAGAIHFDSAVRAFNLGYGDALGALDAAAEVAPACVMAHLLKGWIFALATDPGATAVGRQAADAARVLPRWTRGKPRIWRRWTSLWRARRTARHGRWMHC